MPCFQHLLQGLLAFAAAASAAPAKRDDAIDYVLVGGGPAGFVLAEYLTRDPEVKVLLLEVGSDESTNPNITTPAQFFFTQEFMWDYHSQPDPNLGGLTPNLWQGRILGGGTGVNAMLYCRGAASVFDEWAEVSGNEGLRWESILESFKATTHWTDEPTIEYEQVVDPNAFGDGPLEIVRQRELLAFDRPFATKLQQELDLPEIDFVSGQGIGVSLAVESIRASNRTRSYAHNTFGFISNNRPNFELRHHAWVSKIGFTGKTADRVYYTDTRNNTNHTVYANEVIVTAGAINSPQLLMLSGVGPADHLNELGIPVVQDIPEVGKNLQDHHLAVLQYEASPEIGTVWQWQSNETNIPIQRELYERNGDGLLGQQNGDVFGAFRLPESVFEGTGDFHTSLPADRPNMIYEYATTPFLQNSPNVSLIGAFAAVVQPESRGYLELASTDYRDAPLIYANYWGTEGDKAAIIYGYKELRSFLQSDDLKPLIPNELFPGGNVTSDDDIWAAIQQSSMSWHHPVGTTALGTVLDANWRVKGLSGLRVVGTSSAPNITTCATQGMAYAIGHRAALDIAEADGLSI